METPQLQLYFDTTFDGDAFGEMDFWLPSDCVPRQQGKLGQIGSKIGEFRLCTNNVRHPELSGGDPPCHLLQYDGTDAGDFMRPKENLVTEQSLIGYVICYCKIYNYIQGLS